MANVKSLSTKEIGALKRIARSEALNDMAEADPEMFRQFMDKRYAEHGLGEYVPEPTAEEKASAKAAAALVKAKADLEELLAKHPELRGQVVGVAVIDSADETETVGEVSFGIDPDLKRS